MTSICTQSLKTSVTLWIAEESTRIRSNLQRTSLFQSRDRPTQTTNKQLNGLYHRCSLFILDSTERTIFEGKISKSTSKYGSWIRPSSPWLQAPHHFGLHGAGSCIQSLQQRWMKVSVCLRFEMKKDSAQITFWPYYFYPTKQENIKGCLSWFTVPAPQALPMGDKQARGKGLDHLGQILFLYNIYIYIYNYTYKYTATSIHVHQQICWKIWTLANGKHSYQISLSFKSRSDGSHGSVSCPLPRNPKECCGTLE